MIHDYAIALQKAIEYHCKGKEIPESIVKECPHHSKMLNDRLAFLKRISEQKPEKPDYWSSCGQCERNADDAQELLQDKQL